MISYLPSNIYPDFCKSTNKAITWAQLPPVTSRAHDTNAPYHIIWCDAEILSVVLTHPLRNCVQIPLSSIQLLWPAFGIYSTCCKIFDTLHHLLCPYQKAGVKAHKTLNRFESHNPKWLGSLRRSLLSSTLDDTRCKSRMGWCVNNNPRNPNISRRNQDLYSISLYNIIF